MRTKATNSGFPSVIDLVWTTPAPIGAKEYDEAMYNDDLRALSNELGDDDLSIFTAVRLARDDVARGDIKAALSRLRIDADKIRTLSPRLYELIALRGEREETFARAADHDLRTNAGQGLSADA